MPVGAPVASRSITPPAGSGLAAVMPAAARAAEFTQKLCCETSFRTTGCAGATWSSISAGRRPKVARSNGRQGPPTIQAPGAVAAARAATPSSTACKGAPRPGNTSNKSRQAPHSPCVWLSISPGQTVRPCSGTTRVPGPASAATSAARPTARSRPPAMASASARGWAGSSVRIAPPVRIRSGTGRMGPHRSSGKGGRAGISCGRSGRDSATSRSRASMRTSRSRSSRP